MKRARYFQWLDGENAGKVETLSDISCVDGEYFFNFSSGESCNQRFISQMTRNSADLKDKFMVEIINPSDTWGFETIKMGKYTYMDPTAGEQTVDVPPLEDITGASGNGNSLNVENSKIGQKRYTPPKYKGEMLSLPSYAEYSSDYVGQIEQPVPRRTPVSEPVYQEPVQAAPAPVSARMNSAKVNISGVSENDPVKILAKTCKKHSTEVNLTLNINLPSKSIYNIAKSEFDDGGEKFVDCLVEEMNISEIVKAVSVALREAYEESDD